MQHIGGGFLGLFEHLRAFLYCTFILVAQGQTKCDYDAFLGILSQYGLELRPF